LNHWRALFLIIIVWSCSQATEKKQRQVLVYYDIKGLMEEQLSLLDSVGPELYKEAVINDSSEKQRFSPEVPDWAKELEVFLSADINRPMLSDSYITKERQVDSGSSLSYISKMPRATLVDTLSVLLSREGKLYQVHAYLENTNALFTSVKTLEMGFTEKYNRQILKNYTVVGWQKMVTKDSMSFNISATIDFP
jgi:hypothetical protein